MKREVAQAIIKDREFHYTISLYVKDRLEELSKLIENEEDIYRMKKLQGAMTETRKLLGLSERAQKIWERKTDG